MTNDTSKLDGALMELGDTMADNLVAMGVTGASSSDGLTSLATKILDIPGGGTVLFEDDCSSAVKLSEYGETYSFENGATSATLTYDTTMNAYKLESTTNGAKAFPITTLTGETELILEAEFYLPSTSTGETGVGWEVIGTNHTSWGTGVIKVDNNFIRHIFRNNSWVSNTTLSTPAILNEWLKFKVYVDKNWVTYYFARADGTIITMGANNLNSVVGSSYYSTDADRQYGIGIAWSSSNCIGYVRNIKATSTASQ